MQPQVPIRNYVYFFVSVLALLFGWSYLRPLIFPPPEPPHQLAKHKDSLARTMPVMTDSPWTDAIGLAARLSGKFDWRPAALTPAQWPVYAATQEVAIEAMHVAFWTSVTPRRDNWVDNPVVEAFAAAAKHEALRQSAIETVTLGGKGYPITATLSDRGAGVIELGFRSAEDFPAADKYGKHRTGEPVTLIPRIESGPPAFAVFHYATSDETEDRPLDTLGTMRWKMTHNVPQDSTQTVEFTALVPDTNVKMIKTFTLAPGEFHLGLSVRIEPARSGEPLGKFRYQLAGARGLPIEGQWYATTFRNAMFGLADSSGKITRVTQDAATLSKSSGSDRYRKDDKRFAYAAVVLQYFASAIVVDNLNGNGESASLAERNFLQFVRATVESTPDKSKPFLDDITVRAVSEPVEKPATHRYLLYHGPVKVQQLARLSGDSQVGPELVDRYANTLQLSTLTDYGSFGWWTDVIVMFTNLIHKLVGFLTTFLPEGLAIIGVTIIVRGLMFPISRKQAIGMQKMQEKMQRLAPEMREIEKKFKDDFMGRQQAQRELYRKHNVNPAAGLGGCLMLILQMPIFMGLYYALQESVFFRLKSFLWIHNLTAPDMAVWWGENIPWLSKPEGQGGFLYLGPYLNILPLIGAALIWIQQKASMPKEMSEEQRTQFTVMKYMTVVMVLMFYKVPAGLSLYFIASSLWGLTERKLVKKHLATLEERAKAEAIKGGGKPKPKPEKKPPGRLALWWEQLLKDASKK